MAWITPKLDWTASNYMNAADLNRIENNIAEVAAYLNSINYSIPALTTVTSRDKTRIDYLSDINRIEQNLEAIRANFLTPAGYLPVESWTVGKGFDYTDANRLEANVKLLLDFGVLAYQNFRYCGTQTCGTDWGLIY
jgi:hypothetical protein